MPLQERHRLIRAFRATVQSYHDAVEHIDENNLHATLHKAELARSRVESARAALLRHEHLPVLPTSPTTSQGVPLNGSSVALFNVDTERWVLFEIATAGAPPDGALAFAPPPSHNPGLWITDPRDMSERERHNEKLYFTEAGLAILRAAGLEM
jgi:hypothetical protein